MFKIFIHATEADLKKVITFNVLDFEIGKEVGHFAGVHVFWYGARNKCVCCAKTKNGEWCKNFAVGLDGKCKVHTKKEKMFNGDIVFNQPLWMLTSEAKGALVIAVNHILDLQKQ